MRKFLTLFSMLMLIGVFAFAQSIITGRIVGNDNTPLVGATVRAGNQSTVTGPDGTFTIRVNNGTRLTVSYVGYAEQTVTASSGMVVNLQSSVTTESEVIVTGVATGQSIKKTGFAITKVSSEKINIVPATDASQSLRGKVAGITITQTQGDGGASVFLRGAKSIFGNVNPLIVVDGFQTNLRLSDLNPQDIESIEVVKGAAASSLYGSRAEGGVIQILSKKGKGRDKVNIVVDNEYGISNIERLPQLANLSPFRVDANGQFILASGQRILDLKPNGSANLNPFPAYFDNSRALLNNKPYYNNFISASTSGEKFNLYASFQNQFKGGIVEPVKADRRRSAKFNFSFKPNSKIETGINIQYFNSDRPSNAVSRNNQGTVFAATLQFEPFINLNERDANGNFKSKPTGFTIQGANLFNPLYQYSQQQYDDKADDVFIGTNFKYNFNKHISAEVSGSINRNYRRVENYYPIGYETITANPTLNDGFYSLGNNTNSFKNGNAQINYNNVFGKIEFSTSAKYLYEEQKFVGTTGSGSKLTAPVKDLSATDPTRRNISNSFEQTVRHNYFLTSRVGWNDRVYVDALVRLDNSSRYGSDAAQALFYRGAVAYRLTQDFKLGFVNDLKLRVAYGTAGSEPPYGAKDSRVQITNTGVSIVQNENTKLSRSETKELEVGFDATLFNRLNMQVNYARAKSTNDFIQVPPFAPTAGSASIFKNLGAVKSNSIEMELNGDVLRKNNFNWNTSLTFGRVRSEITALGEVPEFTDGGIFRKQVGASASDFFVQRFATSLNDFVVDANGVVTNAKTGATGGLIVGKTKNDFVVNSQGFVVLASSLGTSAETPIKLANSATGDFFLAGNAQPDFQIGFANTFTLFKNLSVYALVDWKKGGLKYNQTSQYLTFDNRSKLFQDFAQAGLPYTFAQQVYNGNTITDYFLEDNSFVAIREVSLSYSLSGTKMGTFGKVLKNASLALIGRNLFTFTDYKGSNVEGNYEYYPYPVYRTYSARLIFNF